MSLGSRIADRRRRSPAAEAAASADSGGPRVAPIDALRDRVKESLLRDLGRKLGDTDRTPGQLKNLVSGELERLLVEASTLLSVDERDQLANAIIDDVLGYGPIEPLLADPAVSEIMVNGTDTIYVERAGRIELTDIRFRTATHLRQVIVKMAASVGRRVDDSSPMVDARLNDGSRVNAVIPPLAVDGPVLTIRKFSAESLTVDDLVRFGSLSAEAKRALGAMVRGRLNIVVSGGTGTGKTTFLNVLSGFIPAGDRIVTVEDAVELQLRQRHVIRLETRPPNVEGRGQVGITDLVRNSLRMRPDRIIVGECRGAEALDMLQAMNTGHEGSLGTLHANNPRDALARLETMVLMTGFELPITAIREQLASAVDVVVQLERLRDGARVVTSISEVAGMEDGQIITRPLFVRSFDGDGGSELVPTGAETVYGERLAKYGEALPDTTSGPILPPSNSADPAPIPPTTPALPPIEPAPPKKVAATPVTGSTLNPISTGSSPGRCRRWPQPSSVLLPMP